MRVRRCVSERAKRASGYCARSARAVPDAGARVPPLRAASFGTGGAWDPHAHASVRQQLRAARSRPPLRAAHLDERRARVRVGERRGRRLHGCTFVGVHDRDRRSDDGRDRARAGVSFRDRRSTSGDASATHACSCPGGNAEGSMGANDGIRHTDVVGCGAQPRAAGRGHRCDAAWDHAWTDPTAAQSRGRAPCAAHRPRSAWCARRRRTRPARVRVCARVRRPCAPAEPRRPARGRRPPAPPPSCVRCARRRARRAAACAPRLARRPSRKGRAFCRAARVRGGSGARGANGGPTRRRAYALELPGRQPDTGRCEGPPGARAHLQRRARCGGALAAAAGGGSRVRVVTSKSVSHSMPPPSGCAGPFFIVRCVGRPTLARQHEVSVRGQMRCQARSVRLYAQKCMPRLSVPETLGWIQSA
jgi:hypothetical protein